MRVAIPHFEEKSKLFAYLKSNRKKIIAQKCSSQIKSDDFEYGCLNLKANSKDKIGSKVTKSVSVKEDLQDGEIEVDAIANMAGWCDSYMDVLIPDCWNRTIKEKGASNKQLIYHLKNHWYSTDDIIGGNVQMRSQWLDLSIFNIESDLKQGQALIGNSIVKEKYDKKCFHLYSDDEIKQHSIGLRYIKITLCMNSEEEEDKYEKESWDKFYPMVINKSKVDSKGFFWAVEEIKLVEYSAVLFGANELTTVQGTSKNNTGPSKDTQEAEQEPSKDIQDEPSISELCKHLKLNYDE
ncbi:hypothetical protein [Aquimarina macrocephali]|uniref:hypothetical protein n=1 Tax=Aquimarina macrocephali TaxID=666563 RepID=UPI003F672566